ncbi:MAG: NAD(P)-binding domain-containing protein [Deltaproteobacteria bacterium]|nr:NAD(P)-binding domain-containing protein [Deltaproteobacteria bacterium]MBW2498650.1 NAD(P)-binding domain-containing protein [Deltaproteobacteria bacterium]
MNARAFGGPRRSARSVTAVVIGAGHAGLAMSRCLTQRSIDHVVLERGEVANSWRRERWDSLRLLTPNWQSRLPGSGDRNEDPDGYMSMPEVIDFISEYAVSISAPVETQTRVTSVRPAADDGYLVETNRGEWRCETLVIASGAFNIPLVPGLREALPRSVASWTPTSYRNPRDLEEGGVLVVGASATGLQLADEIHRSGRPVTLAVGGHVRLPRVYRGRDIQYWMDAAGVLDERYDEVDDITRARRIPSPQLVGTPERSTLDLNALSARGVRVVGRISGLRDGVAQFSGSLRNVCQLADLKMNRLLAGIDEWAVRAGIADALPEPERYEPTRIDENPRLSLDLGSGEIRSIVWATGFRPDYSWLELPVFDRKGRLRHDGGVVDAPGIYVMGLPFLRRRKSSFIHGAGDDARELSAELAAHLDRSRGRVARVARA